jgi:membrane associated rhomboid family serine protease
LSDHEPGRPQGSVPHIPAGKMAQDPVEEWQPASKREPLFNLSSCVTLFIALCVSVHLVRTQILSADADSQLLIRTAFIPIFYSGRYGFDIFSVTAPITYSLLHGSFIHLGVNLIWLAAFGSPLATRLGCMRFALFWVATAIAGAALFYAFNPTLLAPLVGASGAISGMVGAAGRFGFQIDRHTVPSGFWGRPLTIAEALSSRQVLVFLGVWAVINLATGFLGAGPGDEGRIAWEAHFGGFLVGFFALPLFLPRPSRMA